MTSSHCSQYYLRNKTYKSQVFEGFCRLQQNDELVDMTLVVEGSLVKVHRTLMVLASPLLKELLRSVPCKHPVLFLSNISHKVLCFILEYIYSGEVNVPNEHVEAFFNAAKTMHITGLENVVIPQTKNAPLEEDHMIPTPFVPVQTSVANRPSIIMNDIQNVQLPIVNNHSGEIFPTYASGAPSLPPPATKNNLMMNKINNHLTIQPTNETISINSGAPVSDKIATFLNFINIKTETDRGSNDHEHFNNEEVISDIKNEDIQTIPMIIEGHGPICLQVSNNINNNMTAPIDNYSNNQNVVNHSNTNGESTNQVDLNTLMNISNTSLVQTQDMAVDISISDLVDNKLIATLNTNNITDDTANNCKAIEITKGKKSVEENDFNISSTKDFLEDDINESDSENASSTGFLSKEQMDQVLKKDAESIIYMVSYRGSLQLIMSHFIYNCQYTRNKKYRRRWRCADYKRLKCLAMIDTQDGVIVNKKIKHCHPNHDDKIFLKVMKRQCFPTIEMAQESAVKRKTSASEHYLATTIDDDQVKN